MTDDTRRRLRIFGAAVTDFESRAVALGVAAAALSSNSSESHATTLVLDATERCRELNTTWLEMTKHIFAMQNRLLDHCAEATAAWQLMDQGRETQSARMEAGE